MPEEKDNAVQAESQSQTENVSPEVADYFGLDAGNSDEGQVASEGETEDNKTADGETNDGGANPQEEQSEEDDADGVYTVAGREFEDVGELVKFANKAYGDNSRLAGELKNAQKEIERLNKKLEELSEKETQDIDDEDNFLVAAARKAALEALKAEKEQEAIEAKRAKYKEEIETISAKPDFSRVEPMMVKILDDYFGGDTDKVSPSDLYKMAKGLMSGEEGSIREAVDDIKKRKKAQDSVKSVIGGGGRKADIKPRLEISPEVADYLKNELGFNI